MIHFVTKNSHAAARHVGFQLKVEIPHTLVVDKNCFVEQTPTVGPQKGGPGSWRSSDYENNIVNIAIVVVIKIE